MSATSTPTECIQAVGRLLVTTLKQDVSAECQDALQQMADAGTPLGYRFAEELHIREGLGKRLAQIPLTELAGLRSAIGSAATSNATSSLKSMELMVLWAFIHNSTKELIPVTPLSAQKLSAQKRSSLLWRPQQEKTFDVYNSPFAKFSVQNDEFAHFDKVFAESRETHDARITAIVNGGKANAQLLPSLLSFEILRDYFQIMSLLLTSSYGTVFDSLDLPIVSDILRVFRVVCDIVSINFSWTSGDDKVHNLGAWYFVLLLGTIFGYIGFFWIMIKALYWHSRSEEVRHGHEGTTWPQLAATRKKEVKMVTFVITCFLMVCLPLMRFAFECLASAIGERDDMIVLGHRVARATILQLIFAVVTIVVFMLPLPILLIRMVNKNRPTGSLRNPKITYDEDGEQVAFDDKVYARLIATDPAQLNCPFRSLYAGFTSNWSHYKVYQLVFKVALIISTVMASGTVCGIVTCSIYLLIAMILIVRAPFSDPLNNFMDRSGKIGALTMCIGGLIIANIASSTSTKVVVTVVIVVNMVSLVTMIGILLFSLKPLRRVIKNWLGTLTFSDTVRDIRDGPSAKIIPAWDLDREIKHRVWQAFWKTVLLSFKNDQLIQRLHELEQAAGASGMQSIKRHWEGLQSEYVAQLRIATRTMLEGVDVFWNDPKTTHLNSQVCFGKMYVRPYPFHCVMVYDESERTAVIDDDKVSDFLFLNFSPAIVEKRLMRQKLRVLSGCGVPIHFPFSRKEVMSLEGLMITDSQGRSRRYNKGGTLELIFHYNKGVINVTNNSEDRAMADGFNVRMTYSDGLANFEIQNDPESYHYTGRVAVMKHEHIGLTKEMHVSTQLKQILAQSEAQWVPGLEALYGEHAAYRQTLAQKHTQLSDALTESFWYFVYSNPNVSRLELEDYLSTRERNSLICELPRTHASALSFLYKRMEFVQSHRAAAFWFLFWDDVFARNGEMECLKPFREDFDPFEPMSICYRVMKREDLEKWLEQRNLRPKWWCSVRSVLMGGKTLFHDKVLALLYDKLDNLISSVSKDAAPTEKLQKLQKGANPVRRDTSKPLVPNDKVTPWAECHNVVANEK